MKNGVVGDSEAISMHTATLGTNTGSAHTKNTGSALTKLTVDRQNALVTVNQESFGTPAQPRDSDAL